MIELPIVSPAIGATPRDGGSVAAAAAAEHAPYLARLLARQEEARFEDSPALWRRYATALADLGELARAPAPFEEAMRRLRTAKAQMHLALALLDLAGAASLEEITAAISDFADAAVRAALAHAFAVGVDRGDLAPDADPETSGLAVIAMGKMGAHELNYSSDIDFSLFYDVEIFPVASGKEPSVAAVRLVAPLVRMLEEITSDGYVFRTDLRLRPDPGATPMAVSLRSAERYYQHLGQNWERAAFIKARPCAGDAAVGKEFLQTLEPFVWRKNLDYAAIADIESIKRQILTTKKSAELQDPVFDVKLGRGGIRDVELFAQTQQLILGGRDRRLRARSTVAALEALAARGAIAEAQAGTLCASYRFFRHVEHRIQMLEDAQTQRVPQDADRRAHLAALCGFADLATFEGALIRHRANVAEVDASLFGRRESLADPLGALSFTGVEDHAETLQTLRAMGFEDPAMVSSTIRGWHHGRIRATRAERARELLTALTPRLLRALAASGAPDRAFTHFADFFAGLNAGVQTLSMFAAEPRLLDAVTRALGAAPRLAEALAHRPALLDAMVEPRFDAPLSSDPAGAREAELSERMGAVRDFEGALNAARRFHREESFRIGMQVLSGAAAFDAAGAAYADLAEACVRALSGVALKETERRFGPAPESFALLALGKFGGCELSEGSDLDLMVVYDGSDGSEFYTKFTQRLISALSAPTEEGLLFEVDMQLRPSGSKGPVAVRLSSFERYYASEAWTWELLALTRLRAVGGDRDLGARVEAIKDAALAIPRDPEKLLADARDMRALMERERPGGGVWDVKLAPGGLVDIEFLAQTLALRAAGQHLHHPNTGHALASLVRAGALSEGDGACLIGAWRLCSALQQVLRIGVTGAFAAETAPPPLKARLAQAGGVDDFAALERRLADSKAEVRQIFRAALSS